MYVLQTECLARTGDLSTYMYAFYTANRSASSAFLSLQIERIGNTPCLTPNQVCLGENTAQNARMCACNNE